MGLGLGISLTKGGTVESLFSSNYSIAFDGADDRVRIPDDSAFDFTTKLSVSFWMKIASNSGTEHLITKYGTSNDKREWAINRQGSGASTDGIAMAFGKSDGSFSGKMETSHGNTVGSWEHVVCTYDGSADPKVLIYIDADSKDNTLGSGAGRSIPTSLNQDTQDIVFGAGGEALEGFYEGALDDVAIWSEVLDADAVTAIYNSGTPIDLTVNTGNYTNSTDLVGYWKMGDGDVHDQIIDHEGTNDGTMEQMTSGDIQADTPPN